MRLAWLASIALLAAACGDTTSGGGDMAAGGGDMAMSGGDMAGFQSLAPCSNLSDYMTGSTTIMFGGALGTAYSPKCLQVSKGAMVTFMGDFVSHPLAPSTRGTTGNPVTNVSTGTSAMVTFANEGFFPYFCQFHGADSGSGMSGVVRVVP